MPGTGDHDARYRHLGSADPATILQQFTDLVPNGYFGNICDGDLADSLAQALEFIPVVLRLPPAARGLNLTFLPPAPQR